MNNMRDILSGSDVIKAALNIVMESGQKAYLVGGTIRDILINSRLGNDYDFAVQGKGIAFAKSFAEKVGGSFFILDDERDAYRVVSGKEFQVDISGLKKNIEEDLMFRDFTINSMAVPLDSLFNNNMILLDPLGGKNDIGNRLLRASSQRSI
ncbi:MAG: polynucleotide adenylyltransferase/metal dependent phosphohydrolase, partial [Deltaproteobacteria bacterium]|nr:polynucleotide adenylyltransferase/metal dependent phosphohydrolase [Deltaproteobacteria bacterium]